MQRSGLWICVVGLLLTITEVAGFGVDFADDSLGYLLVAVGAARCARTGARAWWLVVAVVSTGSAMLSLVGYGGLLTHIVAYTFRIWDTVSILQMGGAALVLASVVLAIVRSALGKHAGFSARRCLEWLALMHLGLGTAQMVLATSSSAYYGPLGQLRQVVGVSAGLLALLKVLVVAWAANREQGRPQWGTALL